MAGTTEPQTIPNINNIGLNFTYIDTRIYMQCVYNMKVVYFRVRNEEFKLKTPFV